MRPLRTPTAPSTTRPSGLGRAGSMVAKVHPRGGDPRWSPPLFHVGRHTSTTARRGPAREVRRLPLSNPRRRGRDLPGDTTEQSRRIPVLQRFTAHGSVSSQDVAGTVAPSLTAWWTSRSIQAGAIRPFESDRFTPGCPRAGWWPCCRVRYRAAMRLREVDQSVARVIVRLERGERVDDDGVECKRDLRADPLKAWPSALHLRPPVSSSSRIHIDAVDRTPCSTDGKCLPSRGPVAGFTTVIRSSWEAFAGAGQPPASHLIGGPRRTQPSGSVRESGGPCRAARGS
jgi:hypothetical protein